MATIATRINSTGTMYVNGIIDETSFSSTSPAIYNLATYSEQFDNVVWAPTAALTITPNSINSPINTLTADTLNGDGLTVGYINRVITYVTGTTYTFSCYFKAGTQSTVLILLYGAYFNNGGANIIGQFNLSTGSTSGSNATVFGMTLVGNGWYRCWISQTCTAGTSNSNQIIRLGSATGNLYAWGYQAEVVATPSGPTMYQGVAAAGTLVAPGFTTRTASNAIYVTKIFDEVTYNSTAPVFKNLISYTQDLTQWSTNGAPNNMTVTADATLAPNNTMTADLMIKSTGVGSSSIGWRGFNAGTSFFSTNYCGSVYLKSGGYTNARVAFDGNGFNNIAIGGYFNLTTGVVNSALNGSTCTITNAGNGWWRVTVTATSGTSGVNFLFTLANADSSGTNTNFAGDGTSGIYVWGAQVEYGSVATQYQGVAATGVLIAPGFAKSEGSDGTMYVTNSYDEVTGMVVTSGMIAYIDAGKPESYPGTGTTIRDLVNPSTNTATLNGAIGWVSAGSASYWNFTTAADTAYITSLLSQNYLDCTLVFYPDLTYVAGSSSLAYGLGSGVTSDRSLRFTGGNGTGPWRTINPASGTGDWASTSGTTYYVNNIASTTAVSLPTGWNILGGLRTNTVASPFTGNFAYTWGCGYTGRYFMGRLAAIVLYNRALTADEHQNNYNYFAARYGLPTVGV